MPTCIPLVTTDTPADPATASQIGVAGALLALLRDAGTEPRPDIQLEALTLAVAADLPVLLWGEPGIGKTAALTQLAAALDLPLTTVIASVHEPSDFSGLPIVGDDPAQQGVPMAPPDWAVRLVRAGRGLLFLDELSTAPPAVQAALLRLVLERRIGALQLPPEVRIVAAANPRSSAADGWELSPPLANRFVHLQWTHDHEVVVRGLGGTWPRATLPRLDPERLPEAVDFARRAVCGLLSARPGLVHRLPSNETRRGGPWPSPRSWEMTLGLVAFATAAGSSREVLSLLVRGTVGDGPGLELLASLDRMDLPDPETLLADPAGADLPERGDLRQAVLDGVVAAVRGRPERSRWDAAWALLVRALETGAPDLVVVPATTLASLRQEDWDVPAAIERLAGAVSLSRRADRAAVRTAAAKGGR
ncbi:MULTISPECIES: AAA family ATPase [Streptomyces]|uniref:AAA family ATPase n=1 Tax=Streptomyces mirabilis TaxID=68239 RepID=A0ABU3UFR3_9ACTN|nr:MULTISPECIES: AAA family ATPase [Streptomyces]MCX4613637.1 AAA family ATPase [Streptomyces mirabilis]MDU8992660.1 AAA family ATPase [Streptomyces mirabilis]QDN91701.1 AAA family ATPase [Streptomyces sp. RLB3-6]QDO02222.1 AAA family ATPase [Streptomyces sp. RLB1-9]QDO12525.1 AAA family ATPase [Streptomyces sp. S1D4-23]